MAWTIQKTWATGDLVTAAWLNTYLRDNTNYLFNRNPPLWVPFADNESGTIGDHTGRITNGANQTAYVDFKLHNQVDYIANMFALVIAAGASGTVTLNFDSDYGAAGEAYNAHSGSSVGNNVAVTQNLLTPVAVPSVVFASATGLDVFGLKITDAGAALSLRWIALQVDTVWSTT